MQMFQIFLRIQQNLFPEIQIHLRSNTLHQTNSDRINVVVINDNKCKSWPKHIEARQFLFCDAQNAMHALTDNNVLVNISVMAMLIALI